MLTHPHTPHVRLALVALMALLGLVLLPRQAVQAADIPTLITQLHDADADVRLEAAEALGQRDDARAVDALIAALRDNDPTVRAQAALSLGELGAPRAIGPLKAALRDEFILVSTQAVTALAKIKTPQAVDPLLLLVRDMASPLCAPAAEALGLTGDARAVPFLLAAMNAHDPGVRQAAARGAVAFVNGRQPVADALLAQLKDADEGVRCAAIDLLTEHEVPGAATALIAIAKDPSATVRLNALRALVLMPAPEAADVFLGALRDPDAEIRATAIQGIMRKAPIDPRAIPDLLTLAKDPEASVRRQAVKALGRCETPEAIEAVSAALRDADNEVKMAAINGVADPTNPRVRETLLDMLLTVAEQRNEDDDNYPYHLVNTARNHLLLKKDAVLTTLVLTRLPQATDKQRCEIYRLLGEINDYHAIDALLAGMQKAQKNNERNIILNAMFQCRDPRIIAALVSYLKDPELQQGVSYLIGQQGAPGVTALLTALADPDPKLAAAAEQGIAYCSGPNIEGALVEALQSEHARVRRVAALKLADMGNAKAADVLATLVNDADPEIRNQAIYKLAEFKDMRAADGLFAMQKDAEYGMRVHAAALLAKLGDARAVDALVKLLNDKPQAGRSDAINALVGMKDPRAIDALITALKLPETMAGAPNGAAQPAILGALLQSNDPRATAALVEHLKTLLRPEFVTAYLHPETLKTIPVALLRQRPYLEAVARELSYPDHICIEPFIAALSDARPYVRAGALIMLAQRRDPQRLPTYLKLAHDADADVRLLALRALGALQDVRALDALLAGLHDANPAVRNAAANALGYVGDRRAVDPLLAAHKAGVSEASFALAKLGDARALDVLIAGVKSTNSRLRHDTAVGLGRLAFDLNTQQNPAGASRCITALIPLLKDDDIWVRRGALTALCSFQSADAFEAIAVFLENFLDERDNPYGLFADDCMQALMISTFPEATKALVRIMQTTSQVEGLSTQSMLKDLAWHYDNSRALLQRISALGDGDISKMATEILAAQNTPQTTTALLDQYVKQQNNERHYETIGTLRTRMQEDTTICKEVAARLLPLLASSDRDFVVDTMLILCDTHDPSVFEPLLSLLQHEDDYVRSRAIVSLGILQDPRAFEPLAALAHSDNTKTQRTALQGLAELGDPRAYDIFANILAHDDADTSYWAIRGLGMLGDPRAVDLLLAQLNKYGEEEEWMHYTAAEYLGFLHDPRIAPALLAVLREPTKVYDHDDYGNPAFSGIIAESLGQSGDVQAVEPLIAQLETQTLYTRQEVAKALGALKDPRAIPALIAAMEHFAGEARHVPAEALTAITGQQLGDDPARWRAWWAAQPAK